MTRSPSVAGGSDGVSLLGVAGVAGVAGVVGVVGLVGAAGASLTESASALSIEKPFSMPSVSHDVQGLAAVRRGAERDDMSPAISVLTSPSNVVSNDAHFAAGAGALPLGSPGATAGAAESVRPTTRPERPHVP